MRDECVIYVAGHSLLNRKGTTFPGCIGFRNDLHCVGCGNVKLRPLHILSSFCVLVTSVLSVSILNLLFSIFFDTQMSENMKHAVSVFLLLIDLFLSLYMLHFFLTVRFAFEMWIFFAIVNRWFASVLENAPQGCLLLCKCNNEIMSDIFCFVTCLQTTDIVDCCYHITSGMGSRTACLRPGQGRRFSRLRPAIGLRFAFLCRYISPLTNAFNNNGINNNKTLPCQW